MSRRQRFIVLAFAMAFVSLGPSAAEADSSWYPFAGATWFRPLDRDVRDLYGSGPGASAGLGYQISSRFAAEVAIGWYRASGEPEVSLVPSAHGTLTLLPFVTELQWSPLRWSTPSGALLPRLSLGPALVFTREELKYQAFGESTRLRGKRSDLGGTAGVAVEWRTRRWRAALCARALATGGNREVVRASGQTDERDARSTPSLGSLGLELRIPLP